MVRVIDIVKPQGPSPEFENDRKGNQVARQRVASNESVSGAPAKRRGKTKAKLRRIANTHKVRIVPIWRPF